MKTIKTLLFVAIIAMTLSSCGNSTEEVTKKTKTLLEEKFKGKGITIKSLILAKKSGNEYTGVLETTETYGAYKYSIDVVDDGESITVETKLSED